MGEDPQVGEDKREDREEGLYSMKGLPQRDWAHDDEGEPARRGPKVHEGEESDETEGTGSGSDDGTAQRPDIPGRKD